MEIRHEKDELLEIAIIKFSYCFDDRPWSIHFLHIRDWLNRRSEKKLHTVMDCTLNYQIPT
ncbi:hypothetical protein HN51_026469 [Arachis hypogaea]